MGKAARIPFFSQMLKEICCQISRTKLPDTNIRNFMEAQAYDIIWSAFQDIQKEAFSAIVFYGQDTGIKSGKGFDELGVLLPIHQFESNMLHHMRAIDGLVLSCREEMIKLAGSNSLDLTSE